MSGIQLDLPEAEYHAHPAISATALHRVLASPRRWRYERDHRVEKSEWDIGHAVHSRVLGIGAGTIAYPEDILTKAGSISPAAKVWAAERRAEGLIPLKAAQIAECDAVAESVLASPKARAILELPRQTEVALMATDKPTGLQVRGRLDGLALTEGSHQPLDLKTTISVDERKLSYAIRDYGYDIQGAVYEWLAEEVYGLDALPMVLIFVEKTAPYDVRTVSLADLAWRKGGKDRMREALDLYAACLATDQWPGADDDGEDILPIAPPFGYYYEDLELT